MDSFYGILIILLVLFSGCLIWQLSLGKKEDFLRAEEIKAKADRESLLKSERTRMIEEINAERSAMLSVMSTIRENTMHSVKGERDALAKYRQEVQNYEHNVDALVKNIKQNNPHLSSQIADAQFYLDMRSYNQLLDQKRPALKAAEEVKKIAGEKRELMKENRQLQYQLDFYEKLFPWLEEFKEVPSDEAVSFATGSYGSEYDAIKRWISPEEYEKLNTADKYQLALDRWKTRKKSDWDIGIEYERFIGYKLECDGYKVSYIGATLGLKDMGRDLLATKSGKTLIIQCKRWSKEKTIHEKHIFQLYGSSAVYAIEHPDSHSKAVFITTTELSDTARKCAEYCGIAVVENCPMGEYPLIKCNANKDGEKIYHLPFDQQYDKIVVSKNKQSCYAWTTHEAEGLGFRRAYRWRPNKS